MDKNGKITNIIFVIHFIVFVIGIGLLSFLKLSDHYVNNTPDMSEWVPAQGSKLETDIANNFIGQFDFVNLNGLMAKLLGEREINDVIKLENGYLCETSPFFPEEEVEANTDNIIAFKDYLEQNGVTFIYAITPNTSAKYDPQIPDGYIDHGNDNLDRIADYLTQGGVNVLDLREELYKDGINAYDMMYKTDHHWNTRMGFYAYQKLCDILEVKLECEIDPKARNIDNYEIETYKEWHLGSRGQRTGKYFGGIDDFELFIPKFDTHLMSADGEREGEYIGMLIDTAPLEAKDITYMREDINNRSIYDRVLERSQDDYINLNSYNDKRILMITDSFGKAVCPFMDISFGDVKWEYGPVDEHDFDDYMPDAVIMMYDSSDSFEPGQFDYSWTYNADEQ